MPSRANTPRSDTRVPWKYMVALNLATSCSIESPNWPSRSPGICSRGSRLLVSRLASSNPVRASTRASLEHPMPSLRDARVLSRVAQFRIKLAILGRREGLFHAIPKFYKACFYPSSSRWHDLAHGFIGVDKVILLQLPSDISVDNHIRSEASNQFEGPRRNDSMT